MARRVQATGVAALMLVCAPLVWLGPLAVLWAAGRLFERPVHALALIVAMGAAVALATLVLMRLDALHCRLTGVLRRATRRDGWRRSSCEGREVRAPSMLDFALILSVFAAVTALLVWYFGYASCWSACSAL